MLALAVDGEGLLVADGFRVFTEQSQAERVERAHRDLLGLLLAEDVADTLAHFVRGLVRESHRQQALGINPLLHHVGDPHRHDAGLAGACARKDEQRPVNGLHSFALLGVEEVVGESHWNGGGRRKPEITKYKSQITTGPRPAAHLVG